MWHDNQTKGWLIYNPALPPWINTLDTLVEFEPYWINVTADCVWTSGP